MNYIDRDPIVKFLDEKINETETPTKLGRGYKMGLQFAKASLELADPLVTCGECKFRGTEDCVSYEAFWELGDDGFCSCGERRDEQVDTV